MRRYNLYLSEPQKEALKALSGATGLSVSEHVRRAIDDYLPSQVVKLRVQAQQGPDGKPTEEQYGRIIHMLEEFAESLTR